MSDGKDKVPASAQTREPMQSGASNGSKSGRFPHVQFRAIEDIREPYVLDTGLAVWEIAWLAQAYGPDVDAIADHTAAGQALIREGLDYASENEAETLAAIKRHTDVSLEELQQLLPGLRVITVETSPD